MTAKDLKNALLQEAVQGKLVPQIPSEGNARELLEEIRKERVSHGLDFANAKSGKKKSAKEAALADSNPCDIPEDEIPFDIPESWCWCRWGDLSESIQYGYNASAKETGKIRMVRISDIHDNIVSWDTVPFCEIEDEDIPNYLLKDNDILFARTGGTVGKSFLVKNIPCQAIYAGYLIRTHYNSEKLVPEYLKFFMESDLYWGQLKEGTIATAQPNCNGQTLSKMLIPLPPLAEQKRIVAAIEQFMPLIEEYGKKETELTELNAKISTLTKKAILQEAVQGKLVPQIKSEGNAMELLEEIRKERVSHGLDFANAKSGKKKGAKEAALADSNPCDIPEDELPFDIPESWEWCRLGEVVKDFLVPQRDKPKDFNGNIPWCRIEDIEGMYLNGTHTNKYVSEDTIKSMNLKVNPIGTVISANSASIGAAAITTVECCTNQTFIGLVCSDALYNYYLYFFLKAIKDKLRKMGTGTTISYISQDKYKEMLIPLPPLAEQKRIVEAIEKLLLLCERLGKKI